MIEKEILGIKVNFGLTKETFLKEIKHYIDSGVSGYICTVNPEFVMDAQKDNEFKEILNNSLLNLPDGTGVLMAGDYLEKINRSKNLKFFTRFVLGLQTGFGKKYNDDRITGADSIYDICSLCEKEGYSVFLLGGWERDKHGKPMENHGNISDRAAGKLKEMYPNLNIVGYSSEFKRGPAEDEKTVKYIKECMSDKGVQHIDVIFVAYNHKHQEKWLQRNMKKIPATLGVGVGGTFDYIAGTMKRAPASISRLHLEWLYRLITEPWRFKRIFKAFPAFPLKVFLSTIRSK